MNFKKLLVGMMLATTIFSFRTNENGNKEPFAVVELFTSEGCSSCPKADELLKEMSEILQKEGKNIYGLSFHVTYWDKLGWKDPYSNELFTERQKKYVQALEVPQPYTPQAVVNGQAEFVGSNPFKFRETVTEANLTRAQVDIDARAKMNGSVVVIEFSMTKAPAVNDLNVAIVENYVEHFVPRGENKSRTLKHFGVVRAFSTLHSNTKGSISLNWPEALTADNASVVLYAQNSKSLKIVGAVRIDVH